MFKRIFILGMLLLAGIYMVGCGRGKTSITLAGSTAFQPFAEKLAEQFMAKNPNVNVTVQGGGSAVGIQSASSGAAQIGMADLVTLPEEAKGLTSTVVAKDGIAIVVNPKNKINNLTTDQARDIFNGKIVNWNEVGGDDVPITVVSREAGSGTRTSFEQILTNITLKKDALIQDSNGTIRETVANDVNSVGYLSHGLINEKIKAIKIDDVECTSEMIIAGQYKLVRPIFLLVKGEMVGEVKNFIDYILSVEGQKTIKDNGLLPAK
ncbi:MAG: phosphate transport system substrate-binding protein [Stygiobacter sp.]|nr:MAG: phosphate transport system substrate-binding protein [Stygiobacter sp.]KAF0214408.1 MAG: phosphate transport system substrate-binding [Ignavibacteria bacterium]